MSPRAQIKHVLFDFYGTLCMPKPSVHQQYAAVAKDHGILVTPDHIKASFKQAFKQTSSEHPLYGKWTGLKTTDEWWRLVIQRTLSLAVKLEQGEEAVPIPSSLITTLIDRFSSPNASPSTVKAYYLFPDVIPCLHFLSKKPNNIDSKTSSGIIGVGVVSNTDPGGVIGALSSFDLLSGNATSNSISPSNPDSSSWKFPPSCIITTYEAGTDKGKTSDALWELARRRGLEERRRREKEHEKKDGQYNSNTGSKEQEDDSFAMDEILVVGDQIEEDYLTPQSFGMKTLLLNRSTSSHSLSSSGSTSPSIQTPNFNDEPGIIWQSHHSFSSSAANGKSTTIPIRTVKSLEGVSVWIKWWNEVGRWKQNLG